MFPTVLIAVLALVVILIFVKKEKDLQYKRVDKISIVLNFVLCFTLIPLLTIFAAFIDIEGGGPELERQILYFIPSFSVLCIAASVALRRKGNGVKSLIAELTVPAVFVLYLIVCGAIELL